MEIQNGGILKGLLVKNLLGVMLSVAAAMAAYYSTVSSLRVSMSAKADTAEVVAIEKRMNAVESAVERSFLSREDFFRFREEVNYRLLKIEFKLENLLEGENNGSKR